MAKEAIKANVGLLFRSDAFQLYPGVLAIIGPENCNSGGIQIQEYLSTTDEIVAELAQILRLPAVPEVTPAQRFDALEAWTRRAHPEGQGAGEGILANAMEDFKQHPLVRDACGEMCDQLKSTRWWWFLEILPLWERRVQPDGTKSSGFRWVASSFAGSSVCYDSKPLPGGIEAVGGSFLARRLSFILRCYSESVSERTTNLELLGLTGYAMSTEGLSFRMARFSTTNIVVVCIPILSNTLLSCVRAFIHCLPNPRKSQIAELFRWG